MTKRILLVNPPFYRLQGSHFNGMSLGLAYIGAVLEQHGHEVRILNADYEPNDRYATMRELFLGHWGYKETLNNLSHYLWQEIKKQIRQYAPDYIGVTMHTGTFKSAQNVARVAKSLDSNVQLVAGGPHATLMPAEVINSGFDYLIQGEGEYPFLALADGYRPRDIPGLAFISKSRVVNNPAAPQIQNLDVLPFPIRDPTKYLNDSSYADFGFIVTGRGCAFRCSFCASPSLWGGRVRFRSARNVVAEIQHVTETSDVKLIRFADDTFTQNREHTRGICNLMLSESVTPDWVCDTRADAITSELVELMRKAGCVRIRIGAESGSDRILRSVHKGVTTEQIRNAAKIVKDAGIDLTLYLMIGFPSETHAEMRQTLDFAREIDPTYCSLSILAPYPGSRIYANIMNDGGKLPSDHWEYFYHQSREMMLCDNVDGRLIEECMKLNDINGKRRM